MNEVMEAPKMDVVKFNVTDAEITRMKEEYLPLTINGIEDKAGLKKVYESRQLVKKTRTALVKHADEMKETAIAWQKKVNVEKNRVVGELEAIEAHLQAEEDKIAAAKEEIRLAEEKAKQERIQSRIDRLAQYGYAIDINFLQSLADEQFENVVASAKVEYDKEQAAKAELERLQIEQEATEKREREALEQKLKEEREALDRMRKEQEEKELAIQKQQQELKEQADKIARLEKEAEDKRQAEIKKQMEVAFKQRIAMLNALGMNYSFRDDGYIFQDVYVSDLELKTLNTLDFVSLVEKITPVIELRKKEEADKQAEKDRLRKLEEEKVAEAERLRIEALRPDKEKLTVFANSLDSIIDFELTDDKANQVLAQVRVRLNAMKNYIISQTESL